MEIELLPSGQVVTLDRRCMAGSVLTMDRAVTTFLKYADVTLGEAIRAATTNPAKVLGSSGVCSKIAVGQPANLILFRYGSESLDIETVISSGEIVYAAGEGTTGETP